MVKNTEAAIHAPTLLCSYYHPTSSPYPTYPTLAFQPPPPVPQHLKAGDFYITRHSNLADVHVMFHMVVDDTLHTTDINSRHPVILGLRNVLKVVHNVTKLE